MFAIQNQRTKKFLYGTDFRYSPPRQRTSFNQMRTYETAPDALFDLAQRKCGKDYRVVCLKKIEVKRVLEVL